MLFEVLRYEEGYRSKAYYCSERYPTIGIGTKIGPKDAPLSHYTFTVTEKIADAMLEEEVRHIREKLLQHRWYVDLNEDRQTIIKSMAYQLGYAGLMKFKKMIAALESKNFDEASRQALDSRWHKQTPSRAARHARVLQSGDIESSYEGIV